MKLLKKVWSGIKWTYLSVGRLARKVVPVAVKIVEGIKIVMDTPVDDVILEIIKTAIPGKADDKLIDEVKPVIEKWLPKVLIELKLVSSITGITDPNEQLKAMFAQLKFDSDNDKNQFCKTIANLLVDHLSDGKYTHQERNELVQAYYDYLKTNKK